MAQQHFLKELRAYWDMRTRCFNPKAKNYKYYGERGITVDPTWMKFNQFLADMGPSPSPKHTLERINNNLGYSKSNCRWALQKEQMQNTRRNVLNQAQVDDIRRRYAAGAGYTNLGNLFGVSRQTIYGIVTNRNWK